MNSTMLTPALPQLGRFTVYVRSLELAALVFALPLGGNLRDQTRRAMRSEVLNIAEGAGQRTRPAQTRYYGISQGSLFEVSAGIDLYRIEVKGVDVDAIIELIREVNAMLSGLTRG